MFSEAYTLQIAAVRQINPSVWNVTYRTNLAEMFRDMAVAMPSSADAADAVARVAQVTMWEHLSAEQRRNTNGVLA